MFGKTFDINVLILLLNYFDNNSTIIANNGDSARGINFWAYSERYSKL